MKRSLLLLSVASILAFLYLKHAWLLNAAELTITGPQTVAQRLQQYGPTVDARLKPLFIKAGIDYPPKKLTLIILKEENLLEVYAASPSNPDIFKFIRSYPILAASGHLGPKLREGDGQVPEGIYAVESLNPNSHYHLALHVNYPNAFDLDQARSDGRTRLGGNIMIHGSDVSIGCVAMGDPAAEDLFVLTVKTGLPQVRLIFSPIDFRTQRLSPDPSLPAWTLRLYSELEAALNPLPLPPSPHT